MPVARLQFSGYQSSNENGGGNHAWSNVQGAGSTAEGAGAYSIRDPNSADMNWIRSQGDGARGSATIPSGSIIKGIVVGFQAHQYNGSQVGGSYDCSIFKAGSAVASKTGSMAQGASIGSFGSPTDLWGLGALATSSYFTNMYFGLHLNFPTIASDISIYAWNGYMDIYYDDPTPVPTAISSGGGNNQSTIINTQFGLQLYAIVTDQGGNPMPGISVTFTLPASGASGGFNSLGGPKTATATTNSSGGAVSPFFFANGTTGNWNPVADVTGSSPLIYVLFNATNNPAPVTKVPSSITIIQGSGQQTAVSTAFPTLQKVKVFDQFSAIMPNVDITWSVPASGARGTYAGGTPAHTFTDVSGIATAPVLSANSIAGAWTENAFPTDAPAVVAPFLLTNLANNSPPSPTSGQVISGSNQSAALGGAFPNTFQVKILDQYGSAYAGATVTVTTPGTTYGTWASNGSITRTAVSDANGLATFGVLNASTTVRTNWSVTIAALAEVANVPFAVNEVFTGLNNVDATIATTLTAVSGMSQITPASTAFPLALSARATNGLGSPIQNVSVTFTAPGSAASCRFSGASTQIVNTDVNGLAVSVIPVATATDGSYSVTASASGLTSCSFPLQNGNVYLPEVCTSLENPQSASSSTIGSAGTTTAWLSPTQAIGNPGSTSIYATNTQQPPATGRSNGLLFNPAPASWAASAIEAEAKITKLNFQMWGRGLPNGGTLAADAIRISFVKNGVISSLYNMIPYVGWGNGVFAQFAIATYSPAAGFITKADLQNSNTGFMITNIAQAGTVPGGGFNLNGAQMSVCYQNVDKSGLIVTIPLQVCIF